MESASEKAFALLREIHDSLSVISGSHLRQLYLSFSTLMIVAVNKQDCRSIIQSASHHGFPAVSAIDKIILHGGFWKLIDEGLLDEASQRHTVSLFGPIFPSLEQHVESMSLAPWITLGAQEQLLDIGLDKFIAIEYGSGISTFFLNMTCMKLLSYEDDGDPASLSSWLAKMLAISSKAGCQLNVKRPIKGEDDNPDWLVNHNKVPLGQELIVFIDGCDRIHLFNAWSDYVIRNPSRKIMILLDNSEIPAFSAAFQRLYDNRFTIVHHYGQVYGQMSTKQCTSIVTFHPDLLVAKQFASPARHDRRWGSLNFQDV
jgi:hypothetical protein